MKNKKSMFHGLMIVLVIGIIGGCAGLLAGCKTQLAAGGAYAPGHLVGTNMVATGVPDLPLYEADSAFLVAYTTFTAVSDYEQQNRAALWKISPGIKHTLDQYRPQAAEIYFRWGLAREAYLQNPVAGNLTTLQTIQAEMTKVTAAVQAGTTLKLQN